MILAIGTAVAYDCIRINQQKSEGNNSDAYRKTREKPHNVSVIPGRSFSKAE
jgi:hypothetical protein